MKETIIYICNAIDEYIKKERNISTDSQAATNKVFDITNSLELNNIDCIILSLGRGRQNKSNTLHKSKVKKNNKIKIIYCAFYDGPFLTHLISMMSLFKNLIYIIKKKNNRVKLVIYNRSYYYILLIVIIKTLNLEAYLDLEDGYINQNNSILKSLKNKITFHIFNLMNFRGYILANSNLKSQISNKPHLICHGIIKKKKINLNKWQSKKIKILFSGSLMEETGSLLLVDTIKILRKRFKKQSLDIYFIITGKGSCQEKFRNLAEVYPDLVWFGENLLFEDYTRIIRGCHLGLSLRLSKFQMSKTTFPSKLIEYINNDLFILTTYNNDIENIFGENVTYLKKENSISLANKLISITNNKKLLKEHSIKSLNAIRKKYDEKKYGRKLLNFLGNKI